MGVYRVRVEGLGYLPLLDLLPIYLLRVKPYYK